MEVAIRAWSRTDPGAWQVRASVDATREHTVAQAFVAVGVPPERAEFFGRLAVVVLVGALLRKRERPLTVFTSAWIKGVWITAFVGQFG